MSVKVSVIIPVYNVERYIEECLDSIAKQTLDNFEVIIVDDGSSDNSMKIVEVYKEKYKFIKTFYQKNQGASAARNKGIKEAVGEYIYFLDSDDYIQEDTLKKCYEISNKNKLDILTFDAESFYDEEYCGKYSDEYDRSEKLDSNVYTGEEFFNICVSNGAYRVIVMIYFYKKSFLLEKNIKFVEGMSLEDNLYIFEAILNAKRIRYSENKFYFRRIRNGSVMTGKRDFNNDFKLLKFIITEEFRIKNQLDFESEETNKNISYVIRDNYYIMCRKINNHSIIKKERKILHNDIKNLLNTMPNILNNDLKLMVYYPRVYKMQELIKNSIKKIILIT